MDNKHSLQAMMVGCCVVLLLLNIYFYFNPVLEGFRLTNVFLNRLTNGFVERGILGSSERNKLVALIALAISTVGSRPVNFSPVWKKLIIRLISGLLLYFGSDLVLNFPGDIVILAVFDLLMTLVGLVLLYIVMGQAAALLTSQFRNDIFNRYNESFPQEERRIDAPLGLHLQGRYRFRNQVRKNQINLVDILRGTLVMGMPGSGKTRYIFRPLISQSLQKGMAVFVYDLKYDDLTRHTWQSLQLADLKDKPAFYSINFDDFSRSHRCNPLDPAGIADTSDAAELARIILFALNRKWVHQEGDFFVESAVNFVTANIWFLRCYENGRYCTLPHLIELIQTEYDRLFSILRSYPEIEGHVNSFVSAYQNGAIEQLQGQIDSARVPLNNLTSPRLFYLLSANEFTLDINNAREPKVVCIGSNPQKQHIYGVVISLFVSRMLRLVNKKGCVPCHLFFDEFPSITVLGMDRTLATARSNKVAITLGIQDLSQLRTAYGQYPADAIFNMPGNLISGQVSGDSARLISERVGKILQEKSTVTTNSRDTSVSESSQLHSALPEGRIAKLSSGEFVGITADSPDHPLKLKVFHSHIQLDAKARELEQQEGEMPVIRNIDEKEVQANFLQIKAEVRDLVQKRIEYMASTPGLEELIIAPQKPGHNRGLKP
jgi:hypothetical protein